MDQQVGDPDPYRYLLGQFHRGIKVRSLAVQVQPLGSHKVWAISENEILILLVYNIEEKAATAKGIAGDSVLEMWLPISLNPIIDGFCRGPEPHELAD